MCKTYYVNPLTGKDENDGLHEDRAFATLFAEVSRLFGLPVANLKRDVQAVVNTVANETDNYLLQYRMDKAMLDINYDGNRKNFLDLLYKAYENHV